MYNNIESDEHYIDRVKKGDCEAFGPLIERYKMQVYRLIYRMVYNRDDAEDLVQEVFIRSYRAIKSFRPNSPFYPWLSRIAVNHTINYLKKERKDKMQPLDWVQNHLADDRHDPVQTAKTGMLKERIGNAMQQLPAEYRTILMLRVEEELSYDEISRMLKIPKGTVMSRLARARQRLREIFKDLGLQTT